jgi:hypothetical protein
VSISPIATTRTNNTPQSIYPATAKVLYTKSVDESGWLVVKLEPSGERVAVCEFIKVAITKEDSRVHFLILEGRYKKQTASLSKDNKTRCLVDVKRGPGAKLVAKIEGRKAEISVPRNDNKFYNQLFATLNFDGKKARITLDSDIPFRETNRLSPYNGQIRHSKPLPKGTYKILTPEAAGRENFTDFYATNPGGYPGLKYHTVWFPVEYAGNYNSSFVHVGNISEGCVTMYQLEMWNPLYLYLISNRLDADGKYVGSVTIE